MDKKQENMLKELMALDFYLIDLHLYLDTHPCDTQALEYYRKYVPKEQELRERYQELYGPLTAKFVDDEDYWSWVARPWPWEKGG